MQSPRASAGKRIVTSKEGGPRIALVGDHDPAVVAHQGIERSLALAQPDFPGLAWDWIHTSTIGQDPGARLSEYDGVWVVPASPYASTAGALAAIRHARESPLPFLGTCGGFQHALLEFAHNALHLHQAEHAELAPATSFALVSPLSCSLVEKQGAIEPVPGTRLAEIYAGCSGTEGYHCSYGLNPAYETIFRNGPLRIAARDAAGEVRAMELENHPFYVITLFQPERAGLAGRLHPLVAAFLGVAATSLPKMGPQAASPRHH